jgi:oligosaccharide repeat unit polymerase
MHQFVFQITRITPQRAFIAGWACWLVCFLVMPVSIVFYGTLETVTLFVCANLAVLLGMSFASFPTTGSAIRTEILRFDESSIRLVLSCLLIASAVAIAAKMVDLITFRGILSATSFADARLKMEANGSNFFSGLYFGLSPTIVAAGVVAIPLLYAGRCLWLSSAALALLFINPIYSFTYGGRSVLFLVFALALIGWILVVPKIERRHIVYGLLLLAVLFFATMVLFVGRVVELMGEHVERVAILSDYTKLVPLDADTLTTMKNLPDYGRYLLYYVTSIGQYVLHGVFEFFYLVQAKAPDQEFLWGRYQFTLFDQMRRALLGALAVPDLEAYNPTTGLFSTFWGPAYIDFGYLMVLYGFVFGYLTGRVRMLVERGDLFALPLYALLISQTFLIPVVNGLLMASSIVVDVGLFGIWLLTRLYSARQILPANVGARS